MRDEDEMEQFERLDKAQQEEMVKYKRPLMEEEDTNMKAKSIPCDQNFR